MTAERVAGFMLFHAAFPRSVPGCVAQLLKGPRQNPARRDMEDVPAGGLHEFLDKLQLDLMAVTAGLGEAFFGHEASALQASSG